MHDDLGNELKINNMKEPLELSFKKKDTITRSVQALYWSETSNSWKTDGVNIAASSSTSSSYYSMQVYHLTEFVIEELSNEDNLGNFAIITGILSVFIIVFLALACF